MSLKSDLALRVNQRLVSMDDGAPRPPGAGLSTRHVEVDKSELTVICRGDAFDFYAKSGQVVRFSASPRVVLAVAKFLVWDYWIKATWCGLRSKLWDWSIEVLRREEHARIWKKWKKVEPTR